MQITFDTGAEFDLAITAARLAHNKMQPATVMQMQEATLENGATVTTPVMVPNPALVADDTAFFRKSVQQLVTGWLNAHGRVFRIPTGEWLQRWTLAEKRAIRAMGASNAQVQAWLDRLDQSPIVNLSDADVVVGVPVVCAALEQAGVIEAGKGSARAAEICALTV